MVSNGQPANQTTFNNAFLSRLANSSTIGKIALQNVTDVTSGFFVSNAQRYLNTLGTITGLNVTGNGTAEADATGNTYNATGTGLSNGISFKAALVYLAGKFHGTTGHKHSGAAGDAPLLDPAAALSGIRAGNMALTNAATSATIVFSSDFASTAYNPQVCLQNTTDTDFSWITMMVTAKTSAGFTVTFSAAIDSSNYVLNYWAVKTI